MTLKVILVKVRLSHSKRREKPSCKNQTIGKLRDPSHFLGPIFVNSKHPFPATKRAFEVNKGRTDVSTSRYERIVKFDKVNVTGVEVFVTSHKDLCTCALWSSATINFLRSYDHPNSSELVILKSYFFYVVSGWRN